MHALSVGRQTQTIQSASPSQFMTISGIASERAKAGADAIGMVREQWDRDRHQMESAGQVSGQSARSRRSSGAIEPYLAAPTEENIIDSMSTVEL
jgi:hypothetical protein